MQRMLRKNWGVFFRINLFYFFYLCFKNNSILRVWHFRHLGILGIFIVCSLLFYLCFVRSSH